MGCSYDFLCRTCKKEYYLGYGSYGTWLAGRVKSVDAYDAAVTQDPSLGELHKNQNLRRCLEEHTGHDTVALYGDIRGGVRDGVLHTETGLYGAEEPFIVDYGDYERINLWEK